MVAGAFPIAKLAYLAVKQISKPIANQLKNAAKSSRLFRQHVCLPPAQFYHFVETRFKMYLMGFGKPTVIPPLNEQMAVELGAELLGEGIVFLAAVATLYFEYSRQASNTKAKEEETEQQIKHFQKQLELLYDLTRQQEERIKQIDKQLNSSIFKNLSEKLIKSNNNTGPDSSHSKAKSLESLVKEKDDISLPKNEEKSKSIDTTTSSPYCNKNVFVPIQMRFPIDRSDLSIFEYASHYASALLLGKNVENDIKDTPTITNDNNERR